MPIDEAAESPESLKTKCPSCSAALIVVRRPPELERRRKPRCLRCGKTFKLTPEGKAVPDDELPELLRKSPYAQ